MILVIAEQRGGTLNRASWETIAAAQQLAAGESITVLIPGAGCRRARRPSLRLVSRDAR